MSSDTRELFGAELLEHLEHTLPLTVELWVEQNNEFEIEQQLCSWGANNAHHYINLWRKQAEILAKGARLILLPGPPERWECGSAVTFIWPTAPDVAS